MTKNNIEKIILIYSNFDSILFSKKQKSSDFVHTLISTMKFSELIFMVRKEIRATLFSDLENVNVS